MRFATKLTLIISGIILIGGCGSTFFIYLSNVHILRKQIVRRFTDHSIHTMDKVDKMLFDRSADIKVLAASPVFTNKHTNVRQITQQLTNYRNEYKMYFSLSYFDMNRVRIADTAGLNINQQHSLSEYWNDITKGNDYATDIFMSESAKMPMIHFASVVKNKEGKPKGVVVSRVPLDKIYNIISELSADTKDIKIDLLDDDDGLIIYSNHDVNSMMKEICSDWKMIHNQLNKKEYSFIAPVSGDKEMYILTPEKGYLDFKGYNWVLKVCIPVRYALKPAIELRNELVIITLAFGIIFVPLGIFFSRKITKPLIRLRDAAREIGKGRLNMNMNITSKDEIGELASSFDQMTRNLRKTMVSKEYVEDIIKNIMSCLFVINYDGRIQTVNKTTLDTLGYTENEILNTSISKILSDEDSYMKVHDILKEGYINNIEVNLLTKEGLEIPAICSGSILHDGEGKITRAVLVAHDITDRKHMEEELKRLSTTDTLTHAYNRLKFDELIKIEIERVNRFPDHPLSLIMYDIDHFKSVNDTYGHSAGDLVLESMADIVRKTIREIDYLIRWGGEEFLIIATGADLEYTKKLAERIRGVIENHPFNIASKITISLGVSQYKIGDDMESCIKRADNALYKAKRNGRNRVEV